MYNKHWMQSHFPSLHKHRGQKIKVSCVRGERQCQGVTTHLSHIFLLSTYFVPVSVGCTGKQYWAKRDPISELTGLIIEWGRQASIMHSRSEGTMVALPVIQRGSQERREQQVQRLRGRQRTEWKAMLWIELYPTPPRKFPMLKSQPPVPQNGTLFGDRAFQEVKLNVVLQVGSHTCDCIWPQGLQRGD